MKLRELTFPILIRYPTHLEGGKYAGLRNLSRFNWDFAENYLNGKYDKAEIVDSTGQSYTVDKIYLMRPTFMRWLLDRIENFLIFRLGKRPIVRIDMELTPTRLLTLEQFKEEFRGLILSKHSWWMRHSERAEISALFTKSTSFGEAIDEIGTFSPSDFMVHRGKSTKVVDLR